MVALVLKLALALPVVRNGKQALCSYVFLQFSGLRNDHLL